MNVASEGSHKTRHISFRVIALHVFLYEGGSGGCFFFSWFGLAELDKRIKNRIMQGINNMVGGGYALKSYKKLSQYRRSSSLV